MSSDDLQTRIHNGERDAFRAVYSQYGRRVYLNALKSLGQETAARSVVKQVFLNLHRELLRSADPVDIPARIRELTDSELLLRRILAGTDEGTLFDGGAPSDARPRTGVKSEPVRLDDDADVPAGDADARELPPLDRTQAYMRFEGADVSRPSGFDARREAYERKPGKSVFLRFLLVLFLLLFFWVLAGIAMDLGWLPSFNLGYGWFNEHIFPLFALGA